MAKIGDPIQRQLSLDHGITGISQTKGTRKTELPEGTKIDPSSLLLEQQLDNIQQNNDFDSRMVNILKPAAKKLPTEMSFNAQVEEVNDLISKGEFDGPFGEDAPWLNETLSAELKEFGDNKQLQRDYHNSLVRG